MQSYTSYEHTIKVRLKVSYFEIEESSILIHFCVTFKYVVSYPKLHDWKWMITLCNLYVTFKSILTSKKNTKNDALFCCDFLPCCTIFRTFLPTLTFKMIECVFLDQIYHPIYLCFFKLGMKVT